MIPVIAIDPGAGGALALIYQNNEGDMIAEAYKCPKTTKEMFNTYSYCMKAATLHNKECIVVIEKVWAFPTDARSRAFNFGVNYGKWLGIIASENVKPQMVTPKAWQKGYSPLSKEKKERKQEIKQIAEEMFPTVRVTLYNADALLIGAWASNNCSYEPYSKEER